MLAESEN